MSSDLTELGRSGIAIVVALLSGAKTPREIASETGISKSEVHAFLKKLKKQGIVIKIYDSLYAVDRNKINSMIEAKKREIERMKKVIQELETLTGVV